MAGRMVTGATPTSWSRDPSSRICRAPSSRTGWKRQGVALGGDRLFPPPSGSPAAPAGRTAVRSSPAGGSVSMYTMFLLAVASAQRSIHITDPYFVPDDKMIETLVQVAPTGACASCSSCPGRSTTISSARQAAASWAGSSRAGIEVYEYRGGAPAFQDHGDRRGLVHGGQHQPRPPFLRPQRRAEPGHLRSGRRQRLDEIFAEDLALSRRVTYQDRRRRGIAGRLLESSPRRPDQGPDVARRARSRPRRDPMFARATYARIGGPSPIARGLLAVVLSLCCACSRAPGEASPGAAGRRSRHLAGTRAHRPAPSPVNGLFRNLDPKYHRAGYVPARLRSLVLGATWLVAEHPVVALPVVAPDLDALRRNRSAARR